MGQVIPAATMPASKISFPLNGGEFPADTAITFTMNVQNMDLGNFVNAQTVRSIFSPIYTNFSPRFIRTTLLLPSK
jgi:hypothetical protein